MIGSSAMAGIQANRQLFATHAHRISRFGTGSSSSTAPDISLAQEMVGLQGAARGLEANLAVLRTEEEMLGTLIDAFA